jgi:hypothetical protein
VEIVDAFFGSTMAASGEAEGTSLDLDGLDAIHQSVTGVKAGCVGGGSDIVVVTRADGSSLGPFANLFDLRRAWFGHQGACEVGKTQTKEGCLGEVHDERGCRRLE